MRQIWKSAGKVILAALILLAVLVLPAGIAALWGGTGFGAVYWRLCAGVDGIVLLMIAILLLTHRNPGKKLFPAWETHFPHFPFLAALLIVSAVLTAAAGIVNYFVV